MPTRRVLTLLSLPARLPAHKKVQPLTLVSCLKVSLAIYTAPNNMVHSSHTIIIPLFIATPTQTLPTILEPAAQSRAWSYFSNKLQSHGAVLFKASYARQFVRVSSFLHHRLLEKYVCFGACYPKLSALVYLLLRYTSRINHQF